MAGMLDKYDFVTEHKSAPERFDYIQEFDFP